jgi:small subunit ribosomal protein S17
MPKRVVIGLVKGDKCDKTRRVEVPRLVRHKKYGKIIHRRTVCYAHDENNSSSVGDLVEIVESRPRSKTKRWELLKIVKRSGAEEQAANKATVDAPEIPG